MRVFLLPDAWSQVSKSESYPPSLRRTWCRSNWKPLYRQRRIPEDPFLQLGKKKIEDGLVPSRSGDGKGFALESVTSKLLRCDNAETARLVVSLFFMKKPAFTKAGFPSNRQYQGQ